MTHKFTLAVASLFVANSVFAAGIDITAGPVVSDGTFDTFDVFISSEPGVTITALDLTFTGNLNQESGAVVTSPFNDGNVIITALGGNPDLDSHFSFAPADVIAAPGESSASGDALVGVFALNAFNAPGSTFQIAQLTIPTGEEVSFAGAVSNTAGPAIGVSGVLPSLIPEPTSLALVSLGLVGVAARRRRV